MAKYHQLANKIILDIESERLKRGDRMQSLRSFAQQHNVSVSTAVSCYEELEKLGWLRAKPQSGFFISSAKGSLLAPIWKPFAAKVTVPNLQTAEQPESNDDPLGLARLELDQTTIKRLAKSFRRVEHKVDESLSDYPSKHGDSAFREAMAARFTSLGFSIKKEELVVTTGCIEAVKNALLVCTQPGDVVAVSSPCFNELLALVSMLGLKVLEIPSQSDGINLDELEKNIEAGHVQACLFSTTHMNPQGLTLSLEQKKQLSALAERYQIPIIEDDVYFELNYRGALPLPASYYDKNGYILWCGSFSKSLSPSLRIGWCKPGRYLAPYLRMSQGVSTRAQFALTDMIQSGEYDRHLKRSRYQLDENKHEYTQYINEILSIKHRISDPSGGLVLWVQVPGLDAQTLQKKLKNNGLEIRTGNVFTLSKRYRDCFRINIGFKLNDDIKLKLRKLAELVNKSLRE